MEKLSASQPGQKANKASFLKQAGYVLLLPVFFLLHNYNELFGFIPFFYMLQFFLGALVFAGILLAIGWLTTRSISKGLFITFCSLVFLIFWGAWHDFVKSFAGAGLGRYAVVLPATIVFFVLIGWYFVKRPQKLVKVSKYTSYILVVLCLLELFNLFMHYQQFRKDNNLIYPQRPIYTSYTSCNKPDSAKPDIYFIIFDEYTNNRMLQEFWGFDNSHITNWLTTKGFYTPNSSKANYSFTAYSISSIFNMNYIPARTGKLSDAPVYFSRAIKSINDNETFALLQKEHYRVQAVSPFANLYQKLDITSFAKNKIFNHHFISRFNRDLAWHFKPRSTRAIDSSTILAGDLQKKAQDLAFIVNKIKSTANDSVNRPPQFVYGHLMTTHIPHAFNEEGGVYSVTELLNKKPWFDSYVNQVKVANKTIQDMVGHILSHNRKNTIVIIMGDHGFRRLPGDNTRSYLPNFSAFYFPDRAYPPSLNNISAVNTFRIIFNQYFCQNLSLLKDSSIIVKYHQQ